MKIYNFILPILLLIYPISIYGVSYQYENGNFIYEINETMSQYIVTAKPQNNIPISRNQNIQERRLRLNATDVIGAYILYMDFAHKNGLTDDYFQIYADGINLHYNAVISNLKQEKILKNDKVFFKYSCNKTDYDIRSATYNPNINLYSLLVHNYQQQRNEHSA